MVPDRKKSNLVSRILSALVMLPIAIYLILTGGLPFFSLLTFMSMLIIFEWNAICEKKPFSLLSLSQAICVILIMLQIVYGYPYIFYTLVTSMVLVACIAYFIEAKIIWAIAGFIYVLGPSASFVIINENAGGEVILWMMIVIWSMDTGAYFSGKTIGGPKLAPSISPNKTWAGLIGGAVSAMVLGGGYGHFFADPGITLFDDALILLLLSGLFALLSQVGDLTESAFKRIFDVKDSGAIIPGHGGVMDRLDGIVFVAPAVVLSIYLLYG